MFASN